MSSFQSHIGDQKTKNKIALDNRKLYKYKFVLRYIQSSNSFLNQIWHCNKLFEKPLFTIYTKTSSFRYKDSD